MGRFRRNIFGEEVWEEGWGGFRRWMGFGTGIVVEEVDMFLGVVEG